MEIKLVKCPELPVASIPDDSPLSALLSAIARATGREVADVSLICRGKRLDVALAAEPLGRLGVTNGSTAIVMLKAGAVAAAQVDSTLAQASEQQERIEKAKRAARLLSERLGAEADYNGGVELGLFNERGQAIELPQADRRGLSLGYLLHAKAKALLAKAQRELFGLGARPGRADGGGESTGGGGQAEHDAERHAAMAVDEPHPGPSASGSGSAPAAAAPAPPAVPLAGASASCAALNPAVLIEEAAAILEEAHASFDAVDQKLLDLGDNYALVCIDTAWTALLGEIATGSSAAAIAFSASSLAAAHKRLLRAQQQLAALHGPALEKLQRRSQQAANGAGPNDEYGQARATYVRLRLLLGVVAFHENRIPAARALLRSADELCAQLTLGVQDDVAIAQLLSLGFSRAEARRSLLACGKDPNRAAAHALEQRERAQAAREADAQRRAERTSKLGRTGAGRPVSARALRELEQLGFARGLALLALVRGDQGEQGAGGQSDAYAAQRDAALGLLTGEDSRSELELALAQQQSARAMARQNTQMLVAVGFGRREVQRALKAANGDASLALDALTRQREAHGSGPAPPTAAGHGGAGGSGAGPSSAGQQEGEGEDEEDEDEEGEEGEGARPSAETEAKRLRMAAEEHLIEESGLVRDVRAAEAAYQAVDLRCEAAALAIYLARV